MRTDGRAPDELRKVEIVRRYTEFPAGSVLVTAGRTRVLCTASVEKGVPRFLLNSNQGWLTAEYGMLPGCSPERKQREGRRAGGVDGRASEIQRLIGRSLRAVTDLRAFPDRTVWLDCDVLQADGGTRAAAVTGACVALHDACTLLQREGALLRWPLRALVAAVSVGVLDHRPLLDLCYEEDSKAEVDLNLVMTADGEFVEVQGSAEKSPFSDATLRELLSLGRRGIESLVALQRTSLGLKRG